MSRTIQEIYDAIVDEKESFSSLDTLVPNPDSSQTFLQDLTSTSKVAIWRLIFWVCAVAIWILENLFDTHTAEIDARKAELIPGTLRWYVEESKIYQDGDELIFNTSTKKYEYAELDLDARIIEQASANEANGEVVITVAKDDGTGSLEKLTSAEKTRFESYIAEIKFAGVATRVISDDPDLLKIAYNIYVDGTVIYVDESNPSDPLNGSLISDSSTYPVVDAIDDYIATLDFKGTMRVADLTDAIQAATGVRNVVATTVEAKYAAFAYTDILALANQSYQSNAGYLDIDPAFPLSSQISYYVFS